MRRFGGLATLAAFAALVCAGPASAAGPLRAEWYSDTGLQHLARVDSDPLINFKWEEGQDLPGVGHKFSVRWTGQVAPRYSEQYRFVITRDDVARLWVGGRKLFDEQWNTTNYPGSVTSDPIALQANRKYDLKVEFAHSYGSGEIRLAWRSPSQEKQIVPASRLSAPAAGPDPGNGIDVQAPGPKLPVGPQPEAGSTLAGSADTGKVLFRKPGSKRLQALGPSDTVPVGSVVDARKGKVQLLAEGAQDKPQSVEAWGSVFALGQKPGGDRMVTLKLKPTRGCARGAQASSRRKKQNRLWAHAHGHFRTRGHGSSATVRGTIWSVTDYCGSTVTTVREGLVAVHDFRRHRVALVPAGSRYVAKWAASGRR
jgi:hypothetical protein